MEFLPPVHSVKMNMISTGREHLSQNISARFYLGLFTWQLRAAVIVLILVVGVVMWTAELLHPSRAEQRLSVLHGSLCTTLLLLIQRYPHTSKKLDTTRRMIYFYLSVAGFVLMACYSAVLTSQIVDGSKDVAFVDFQSFHASGNRLIV